MPTWGLSSDLIAYKPQYEQNHTFPFLSSDIGDAGKSHTTHMMPSRFAKHDAMNRGNPGATALLLFTLLLLLRLPLLFTLRALFELFGERNHHQRSNGNANKPCRRRTQRRTSLAATGDIGHISAYMPSSRSDYDMRHAAADPSRAVRKLTCEHHARTRA